MDNRIVESSFGRQPLTRLLTRRKRSNTVSSRPLNLYAAPTTAVSTPPQPSPRYPLAPPSTPCLNERSTEAQVGPTVRCPPSPFTLATAFNLNDHPNFKPTNDPSVGTRLANTEHLASMERLRVQVDSTNHIHAWLSDVPDITASPLSRNPSVRRKPTLTSHQRMTRRLTSLQLREKDEPQVDCLPSTTAITEEASDNPKSSGPSPVRRLTSLGVIGTLKPATPDSALFELAEAKARIEAYQRTAEYQEHLEDKEMLSSLTGALVKKSLKERIEFFESLEAKTIRKRITDYEATGPHRVYLTDLALLEAYGSAV